MNGRGKERRKERRKGGRKKDERERERKKKREKKEGERKMNGRGKVRRKERRRRDKRGDDREGERAKNERGKWENGEERKVEMIMRKKLKEIGRKTGTEPLVHTSTVYKPYLRGSKADIWGWGKNINKTS